jgi:hypothetical protein
VHPFHAYQGGTYMHLHNLKSHPTLIRISLRTSSKIERRNQHTILLTQYTTQVITRKTPRINLPDFLHESIPQLKLSDPPSLPHNSHLISPPPQQQAQKKNKPRAQATAISVLTALFHSDLISPSPFFSNHLVSSFSRPIRASQ